MTAVAGRLCPKCREATDRAHCNVLGCGWWICPNCRVMFNRQGNANNYLKP